MNIDSKQKTQLAVALGAVVALVLGFSVFNKSDQSSATSAANGRGGFQQGARPQGSYGPSGATGSMGGQRGQGGPGMGGPGRGQMPQQVTGEAANNAKAAAEKKTGGTAQGVMKARSGSGYVVFVQTDNGPAIVEVNKSFKVTGTHDMSQMGPPGQGGQGGQSGQPPAVQGGNVN